MKNTHKDIKNDLKKAYLASECPVDKASTTSDVSSKLLFMGIDANCPEKAEFMPDPKLPKLRCEHS
jgi:hypothetical protein